MSSKTDPARASLLAELAIAAVDLEDLEDLEDELAGLLAQTKAKRMELTAARARLTDAARMLRGYDMSHR